jgi:WD40 repeat protein
MRFNLNVAGSNNDEDAMGMYQEPVKAFIVPKDRVELTETELEEEIMNVLEAEDTQIPNIIHKFNFKQGECKQDPPSNSEHMAIHLSEPGHLIFTGNDDTKSNAESDKDDTSTMPVSTSSGRKTAASTAKKEIGNQFCYDDRTAQTYFTSLSKQHQNLTSTEMQTDDLPIIAYSETVSQATIYEAYVRDWHTNKRDVTSDGDGQPDGGAEGKSSSLPSKGTPTVRSPPENHNKELAKIEMHENIFQSEGMSQSLRVMERMINRNEQTIIYNDYRFWGESDQSEGHTAGGTGSNLNDDDGEDTHDGPGVQVERGMLLPMWTFDLFHHDHQAVQHALLSGTPVKVNSNPNISVPPSLNTQHLQVTSICWNAKFPDLFAIGYGSQDFLHNSGHRPDQHHGAVCCYSLKNASYPEYILETNSAVTSLDFFPCKNNDGCSFVSLLAVGCFNGSVLVYDIFAPKVRNKSKALFESSVKTGGHQSPVWQICWDCPTLGTTTIEAAEGGGGGGGGGDSEQAPPPQCVADTNAAKYPRFYSISGDGQVALWTIRQSSLCMDVVLQLSYPLKHTCYSAAPLGLQEAVNNANDIRGGGAMKRNGMPMFIENDVDDDAMTQDGTSLMVLNGNGGGEETQDALVAEASTQEQEMHAFLRKLHNETDENVLDPDVKDSLASGSCFDFHPTQSHLFIVGTEEGSLHLCSKNFSGQYLETFEGHCMRVNSVRWNGFHDRLFLSCSEDKTVKLWDSSAAPTPLRTFDSFKQPVGDVSWSPHSSTIFAAVTGRIGRIHIYDLAVSKVTEVLSQKVKKKAPLTQVRFSTFEHMVIVGSANGCVYTFKMNSNLRGPGVVAEMSDLPKAERESRIWTVQHRRLSNAVFGESND